MRSRDQLNILQGSPRAPPKVHPRGHHWEAAGPSDHPEHQQDLPCGDFYTTASIWLQGENPGVGPSANPGVVANPDVGAVSALTMAGAMLCHHYVARSMVVPNPATLCCTQVQPDLKPYGFQVLFAPRRGSQPSRIVTQSDCDTRVSANLSQLMWLGGILTAPAPLSSFIAEGQ